MKRRLFNYLVSLSLLLSLAVAALGIRSWFVPDEVGTGIRREASSTLSSMGIISSRGSLVWYWCRADYRLTDKSSWEWRGEADRRAYFWTYGTATTSAPPSRLGFLWLHAVGTTAIPSAGVISEDNWWIGLPHALVWLLTTLLPARWAIHWWRERQKSAAGFPVESSSP